MTTNKSIEPNIVELGNSWLRKYNLDYRLEQESLNNEIDHALNDYQSKNGGSGSNRPDVKLLCQDSTNHYYPVLIEYKGLKDKLVKLDDKGQVENRNSNNEPNYKNINSYAVNGAIHYANALLHHTTYANIIAIGMTGYRHDDGSIQHQIGVYNVSKDNFGIGQKVGEFTDFSFLAHQNFDQFINQVKRLSLTRQQAEDLKQKREQEIDAHLRKLNQDIYKNEKGLGEDDRVYLVAASIIATLGVPHQVSPLDKSELKSSTETGNTDGDILMRKIHSFLDAKAIPDKKKELIERNLGRTLLTENINKVQNGESQLKRVFSKIVDDLGIYYKIGLTTDFTGKLFNIMYEWLGFSQDKLNDVVLTPSYISSLLVKLARVNKDSYVWDFATGSAGLLVSAMNEMLNDAKAQSTSPEALTHKELQIKTEQLLGLELLPNVYMLAILNMIIMGDGSSNILNKDSLTFNGHYGSNANKAKFPADAFVLNPPYSANGNGMNFVEKALNMMHKGYGAIIIQSSAGSGKAKEYNQNILKHNTLIASIKMPTDLFIGKANVQTYIYVFKVNEPHHPDEPVKFIDFTNDGYSRSSRRKTNNNLKDIDNAKEKYQELVEVVRFGKQKLNYISEDYYCEGFIDPKNGADWNQSIKKEKTPQLEDFQSSITNYLTHEITKVINTTYNDEVDNISNNNLNNDKQDLNQEQLDKKKWKKFNLSELFDIDNWINGKDKKYKTKLYKPDSNSIPVISGKTLNNGVVYYTNDQLNDDEVFENELTITTVGYSGTVFYQKGQFALANNIMVMKMDSFNENQKIFIGSLLNKLDYGSYNKCVNKTSLKKDTIYLPVDNNNNIDTKTIDNIISNIKQKQINSLYQYIKNIYIYFENNKIELDKEFKNIQWKTYTIQELFDVKTTNKIYNANKISKIYNHQVNNSLPYVVRTTQNNGIRGYIIEDTNKSNSNNTLSFAQDTFTVFYQKQNYFTGNSVKILHPNFQHPNENNMLFIASCIQNSVSSLSWGVGSTIESIKQTQFKLPVNQNNEIDYQFMNDVISSIKQDIIHNVSQWIEQKVA